MGDLKLYLCEVCRSSRSKTGWQYRLTSSTMFMISKSKEKILYIPEVPKLWGAPLGGGSGFLGRRMML
jgi:hypothetical protein